MTEVQPFIDIINDGVLRAGKIVKSLSKLILKSIIYYKKKLSLRLQ